jgi:hypothetical protein
MDVFGDSEFIKLSKRFKYKIVSTVINKIWGNPNNICLFGNFPFLIWQSFDFDIITLLYFLIRQIFDKGFWRD